MDRRQLLQSLLKGSAAAAAYAAGTAARADMRGQPLTLGVEGAVHASGLAERIRVLVGQELGLVLQLVPGAGLELLDQLQAGKVDAALTQCPLREEVLDRQGLTHSRKLVVRGSHVIVGPATDPAGVKGLSDALAALDRIVQFSNGSSDAGGWVRQGEPSGTQELEGTLWKALGPRPLGQWMRAAPRGTRAAMDMAATLPGGGAYTLVERGLWLATPRSPLKLLVEGDARLVTPCHIALPFRSHHAAAKLLAGWLAMPTAQRSLAGFAKAYLGAKD